MSAIDMHLRPKRAASRAMKSAMDAAIELAARAAGGRKRFSPEMNAG
jgi:D-alanyl-D-alanine carboxypeptidase